PDLITALDASGIRLAARLVVDAPAGAMTPELREALAEHKALLLQRVVRGMVWAELSTWRWGGADAAPGIDHPGRPTRGRRKQSCKAPYRSIDVDSTPALCDNQGPEAGADCSHARPLDPPPELAGDEPMSSVRKRSGAWYARWVDADGRKRERRAGTDRRSAEQLAASLEAEATRVRSGVIDPRSIRYRDHERTPVAAHLHAFRASI